MVKEAHNTKSKENIQIPSLAWWLVSIGAFIAGALAWSGAYMVKPNAYIIFLVSILVGFVMGLIPVCLATFLEKRHTKPIYWLTFFSIWMPAGIFVWIVTIIWAIFDKKRA